MIERKLKRPYFWEKIRYRTFNERDAEKIETYEHLVDRDIVDIIAKKFFCKEEHKDFFANKPEEIEKMVFSGAG